MPSSCSLGLVLRPPSLSPSHQEQLLWEGNPGGESFLRALWGQRGALMANTLSSVQTKEGAFTLSAMTSGIRRNWIQTIMKYVHPTSAPDVTR